MNIATIFEKNKVYKIEGADEASRKDWLSLPFIEGNENPDLIVFYSDSANESLSEHLKVFLSNVLKAANKSIDNVLIINAFYGVNGSKVAGIFEVNQIIAFGVFPNEIAMQINAVLYSSVKLNGKDYLFAEALSDIEKDKSKKIQLWQAMKTFFGI